MSNQDAGNSLKYAQMCSSLFERLFERALKTSGFNYLCTILRVEGMTSGHWDAFAEAEDAAKQYGQLLELVEQSGNTKHLIRLRLLLYCHLTEMSAPYDVLANLFRCCQGKGYHANPFYSLEEARGKRSSLTRHRLLSPMKKIDELQNLAEACGEEALHAVIKEFYSDEIRNAFYHSDYAISDAEFHIVEGGSLGRKVIPLSALMDTLGRCLTFYSVWFQRFGDMRRSLAKGSKYFRWPNHEVLELLSRSGELSGFRIHFPTGLCAVFERIPYQGTKAENISFQEDGISLMVGDLKKFREAEEWYVDGKPFDDYGTRYNVPSCWRPLVFLGDSDKFARKARDATNDELLQGCLFYMYITGHKAIEFVVKSDADILARFADICPQMGERIELIPCSNADGKSYLYDGTAYLQAKDVAAVKKGLEAIRSCMDGLRKSGVVLQYRTKYQLYMQVVISKAEPVDGVIQVTFDTGDPRSTLVASDLGNFPKTDWHIKEAWI